MKLNVNASVVDETRRPNVGVVTAVVLKIKFVRVLCALEMMVPVLAVEMVVKPALRKAVISCVTPAPEISMTSILVIADVPEAVTAPDKVNVSVPAPP